MYKLITIFVILSSSTPMLLLNGANRNKLLWRTEKRRIYCFFFLTEKCMPKEHKCEQKFTRLCLLLHYIEFEDFATEVSNL